MSFLSLIQPPVQHNHTDRSNAILTCIFPLLKPCFLFPLFISKLLIYSRTINSFIQLLFRLSLDLVFSFFEGRVQIMFNYLINLGTCLK